MDQTRHQLNSTLSQPEDNPDVLRRNIQHTRAEIGATVKKIQERLSPDRMKQHMKTAAREKLESVKEDVQSTAEQWQFQIAERIMNNPIPVTMVSVGLVWMWKQAAGASREQDRRIRNYYSLDPYEDWPGYAPEEESGRVSHESSEEHRTLETVKAKAMKSGGQAREQISQWTSQAQDSLEEWKSRAFGQTDHMWEHGERAKGEFRRCLQDNPLAIGAVTLAIGAAVGLSLPRTQKEDQWVGETRDRLINQAKATAKEILPKTKEIVDEITQTARESIKEHMSKRAI